MKQFAMENTGIKKEREEAFPRNRPDAGVNLFSDCTERENC